MTTYFEVEKESRKCVLKSDERAFLGYEGENNANTLVFEFKDEFVDGMGVLNIKRGEEYGYVEVDKVDETYQFPVRSAILSKVGDIEFQLVITQTDGTVYKFNPFIMNVKDAIDADNEMPEDYPSWVDMANAKLAEIDQAIIEAENVTNQLLKDKENGVFNGKDGADGTMSFEELTEEQKATLKGDKGDKGETGTDGFSPTVTTTQTETGVTITITDKNGTTTTEVKNGIDGYDGIDGDDGFSPSAKIEQTEAGAIITITDQDGTTTAEIFNGKDGKDGEGGTGGGSSSVNQKVLWEGDMSTLNGKITLSESLENYDYILVEPYYVSPTNKYRYAPVVWISTERIKNTYADATTLYPLIVICDYEDWAVSLYINFSDNKNLSIAVKSVVQFTNAGIKKIIGVKF